MPNRHDDRTRKYRRGVFWFGTSSNILLKKITDGVVENLKIITASACERIAKYAFEYAKIHGHKRIVAAHKRSVQY